MPYDKSTFPKGGITFADRVYNFAALLHPDEVVSYPIKVTDKLAEAVKAFDEAWIEAVVDSLPADAKDAPTYVERFNQKVQTESEWNYIDDGKYPVTCKRGPNDDKVSKTLIFVTRKGLIYVGRYESYPYGSFETMSRNFCPEEVLCWVYASDILPPIDTSRLDPDNYISNKQ